MMIFDDFLFFFGFSPFWFITTSVTTTANSTTTTHTDTDSAQRVRPDGKRQNDKMYRHDDPGLPDANVGHGELEQGQTDQGVDHRGVHAVGHARLQGREQLEAQHEESGRRGGDGSVEDDRETTDPRIRRTVTPPPTHVVLVDRSGRFE